MTIAEATNQSVFDVNDFLKNLTRLPGIYKMLNDKGTIVYIGKAKNLKNRVSSYFKKGISSAKQQVMIAKIKRIEVIVTQTEGEALLLESQLIKQHKPRFNICLRDDKSYPFIYLSTDQPFPQISLHRGAKKKKGHYYGPYPSAGAVRETLKQLQKIFPIRQCDDSYYKNRSRPCLQHQIKRCTAPCMKLISQEKYAQDVSDTQLFLTGKANLLIDKLVHKMDKLASHLQFERAAQVRDQISQLRTILEKNCVHGERGDVDIIACATRADTACVQIFFIRNGQHLGHKIFFPKISNEYTSENILHAFIAQYYLDKNIPYELIVSHQPEESHLLVKVLSHSAKHTVTISSNVRSQRAKWLQMANTNAKNTLLTKLADKQGIYAQFLNLQDELGCQETPQRLECFDISHTQGEYTVASCVVFNREGPIKSAYRRFNISGITPSDDYAAIYQAVYRRFKRLVKGEHKAPDILFIDGGKGQVNVATKALAALQINNVMIIGIAKGIDRKAGMEKIILPGQQQSIDVTPGASSLLLIQHIRDEAHRFAITGHRTRRGKAKKRSTLEAIAGLGPQRRQILLKQFGGIQSICRAGIDDLCSVNGIGRQLARHIYDTFHHQDD